MSLLFRNCYYVCVGSIPFSGHSSGLPTSFNLTQSCKSSQSTILSMHPQFEPQFPQSFGVIIIFSAICIPSLLLAYIITYKLPKKKLPHLHHSPSFELLPTQPQTVRTINPVPRCIEHHPVPCVTSISSPSDDVPHWNMLCMAQNVKS